MSEEERLDSEKDCAMMYGEVAPAGVRVLASSELLRLNHAKQVSLRLMTAH